MFRRAIWMALLVPGSALAWPATADWVPFEQGGTPLADTEDLAASLDYFDLIGTSSDPVALWYADPSYVYLRLQLVADPVDVSELSLGAWGWLVETDGAPTDFERLLAVIGPDGTIEVYDNQTSATGTEPAISAYRKIGSYGDISTADVRVAKDGGYYVIDLQFTRADANASWGIDDQDTFRVVPFSGGSALVSRYDLVGCDDSTSSCGDLEPLLSDAVSIDADADGLTGPEELNVGSDGADADTDDDGLIDGLESLEDVDGDGTIGIFDCDSDDDGIHDGTELGSPNSDTDTSSPCYVPDADSTTSTDPNDADTDDGGLRDGVEDWNHNGRIDAWETDPNDPSDDEDTDGDGIADALEGGFDADGDSIDNAQDLDSDGDGRNDSEEGLVDSDGDGTPDFLDFDSDDDTIPDADEGDGDTDEDGTPDWRDPDADGDGTPDIDEGTGDDDCDGIPNWIDADDTDGVCDTGDPPVDTGPLETDDTDAPPLWPGGTFTGGACSAAPVGALWFPALIAGAALLGRRRKRVARAAVPAILLLAIAPEAAAQEVNAQRFSPSVDGRAFVKLEDTELAEAGTAGGGLWFNHADDPFVYRYADESGELPILGSVGTASLVGFYSLGALRIGADIPLHLYRDGFVAEGVTSGSDLSEHVGGMPPGMGDLRLSTKLSLASRGSGPVGAALWLDGVLPTGASDGWVSSGAPVLRTGVSGTTGIGRTTLLASAGVHSGNGSQLGELRVSPAAVWGLGASQAVTDALWITAELDGEQWLGNAGQTGAHPVEWLLAARVNPTADLVATLGGGSGLTQGVGAPDMRVLASVAWVPPLRAQAPVIVSSGDSDRDGIADLADLCPQQAEDMNGVEDEDGCPDAGGLVPVSIAVVTTGGAAIAGARVEILAGPETGSWVAADGVVKRALPPGRYELQAEAEGFARVGAVAEVPADAPSHALRVALAPPKDVGHLVMRAVGPSGVPVAGAEVRIIGTLGIPLKTGTDGIFEADLIPGDYEASVAAPGWTAVTRTFEVAPAGRADVTVYLEPTSIIVDKGSKQIFLHRKVFFELDRADLKLESLAVLDDLVQTLKEHPEVRKLRIEGHTDTQGSDEYNLKLSQARAQSVVDYLVRNGVDAKRLEAKGYGEGRPLQQGENDTVHATNRRVEFHIVELGE